MHGISGEIIVADNGSSDGSQAIATRLGATVIRVPQRGYGRAIMDGIAASSGRYIVLADADDSYDFLEVPRFLEQLRQGYDLVQGCRLPVGGGTVREGAMPFLHRWWGNPMFAWLARHLHGVRVHDVLSGMRGFTRELYDRLDLRSPGFEFGSEMILEATRQGARLLEIPIILHPDGRTSHPPHLRTFRDGWRHLRFFLFYGLRRPR